MAWKHAGLRRLTRPELNDFYNGSFFYSVKFSRDPVDTIRGSIDRQISDDFRWLFDTPIALKYLLLSHFLLQSLPKSVR
jgi:hypothetical protein